MKLMERHDVIALPVLGGLESNLVGFVDALDVASYIVNVSAQKKEKFEEYAVHTVKEVMSLEWA